MLAGGNVIGAFDEYHRLAELGSGIARCIIAYAYLLGTHRCPKNIEEARRIALSAAASEPGFSNYILASIAMLEHRWPSTFRYLNVSRKSGFLPALSTSAKLMSQLYRKTNRDVRATEKVFWHAIRSGHIPGFLYLMVYYRSGTCGFLKRLLGLAFFPFAVASSYLSCRFAIFSMRSFFYHPSLPALQK
ncbi:MAG TPA: hypothetical protein VN325_45820 [Steroidobacteraceae bacterium]|nr:hypothetical protein [Steroidobacteraceae bacterium]